MSTHVDEVAEAFRATYGAVVDHVSLPADEVPVVGVTTVAGPRFRGWQVAAASTVMVLLAVGAVALLHPAGDPTASQSPVTRVALVGAPDVLGGEATIINSSSPQLENGDDIRGMEMWQWTATADGGSSVVVLEATPGDDLSTWWGPDENGSALTAPSKGDVVAFHVPDMGWVGRSWMAGDRWRVAIGFDDAAVTRVTDLLVSGSPISADLDNFKLVYQGSQWLYPAGTELTQLFYTSPRGGFSVGLFRDWPHGMDAVRMEVPDFTEIDINGTTGLVWQSDANWMIAWPIDDQSLAMVDSSDLNPEQLAAVARSVRPVSVDEWNELAASAPDPQPGE